MRISRPVIVGAAEERKLYDALPCFWSDQYDAKIQSLGVPGRASRREVLKFAPDGSQLVYVGERPGAWSGSSQSTPRGGSGPTAWRPQIHRRSTSSARRWRRIRERSARLWRHSERAHRDPTSRGFMGTAGLEPATSHV